MKFHGVWIAIGIVCAVTVFLGDWSTEAFRFDRTAISNGDWWRIVTSHFIHFSYGHLLLNLVALGLAGYVASPSSNLAPQIFAWLWLIGFTGLGLWFLAPDLNYFVGLSGVLHGAMLVAIASSPYYSLRVRWAVGVVIISKVLWEQTGLYDDMANIEIIGGRTEPRSHLYGTLAGLIWVVVWFMIPYGRNRNA